MRAWTLGSGSRGNAIVLESGHSRVLIDAGFPLRVLQRRLASVGIPPESIQAVVVTHEHIDHARGVAAAQAKWGWTVIASAGTLRGIRRLAPGRSRALARGGEAEVGDFRLRLVPVAHDASEPTAVLATNASGFRAGVAHDLGAPNPTLAQAFERLDLLLLESNHDVGMLRAGPYPLFLQDRILGPRGHLSNRQSADLLGTLAHSSLRHVVLLHLSETNNVPTLAVECATRASRARGVGCAVSAAGQGAAAGPFGLERERTRQLALAL